MPNHSMHGRPQKGLIKIVPHASPGVARGFIRLIGTPRGLLQLGENRAAGKAWPQQDSVAPGGLIAALLAIQPEISCLQSSPRVFG